MLHMLDTLYILIIMPGIYVFGDQKYLVETEDHANDATDAADAIDMPGGEDYALTAEQIEQIYNPQQSKNC